MTQFNDVYELFRSRLVSICSIHLAFDFNGKAFNSIEVKDQLPGEDVCGAIARHMCEALTDGSIDKQ